MNWGPGAAAFLPPRRPPSRASPGSSPAGTAKRLPVDQWDNINTPGWAK